MIMIIIVCITIDFIIDFIHYHLLIEVPNYYSNQNYHQKFWKMYVHNEVLMLQIKHLLSEI